MAYDTKWRDDLEVTILYVFKPVSEHGVLKSYHSLRGNRLSRVHIQQVSGIHHVMVFGIPSGFVIHQIQYSPMQ